MAMRGQPCGPAESYPSGESNRGSRWGVDVGLGPGEGECRGEGAGRGSPLSEAEQCGGLGSSMEPIWWGAEAALGRPVM